MSAVLEQSIEDIAYLKGAIVEKITLCDHEEGTPDDWRQDEIWLHFKLKGPQQIRGLDFEPTKVIMAVLQDPEGNGPGFLELVEASGLAPKQ